MSSELQIISFIKRRLSELKINKFTEKTIKSDFKVFVEHILSLKRI